MLKNKKNEVPKSRIMPPRFAEWVLNRLSDYKSDYAITGDMAEEYKKIVQKKGKLQGFLWYWRQLFHAVPSYFNFSLIRSKIMFSNYVKIAFRNLIKHLGHSLTNIFGLSVGMAFCILIFIYVRHETSYDSFHEKSENIYRVWKTYSDIDTGGIEEPSHLTSYILGEVLSDGFPDIKNMVRITDSPALVISGENSFNETFHFVSPGFFEMFSFTINSGNQFNPLVTPNDIVLTESMAKKYFGSEDPIGKKLRVQFRSFEQESIVTAITKDVPQNSTIQFEFLVPFELMRKISTRPTLYNHWGASWVLTFVELLPTTSAGAFEEKLITASDIASNFEGLDGTKVGLYVQPLTDIHLNTGIPIAIFSQSNPLYSYILSGLAMLVLFIACVNYVTLAIGRSSVRAKEVGVRKTMGAFTSQLTRQYLGESIVTSMLSLVLSIGLVIVIIPFFNELTGKQLSLGFDVYFLVIMVVFSLIIGSGAGVYPAIVLSRYNPVRVLKGVTTVKGKNLLNRFLVVTQFSLSVFLIIATLVVRNQLNFISNKDLGYEKEFMVSIPLYTKADDADDVFRTFKNELLKSNAITSVSASSNRIGRSWTELGFSLENEISKRFYHNLVDVDYLTTMGLTVIAGRGFSDEFFASDVNGSVIVNEAFVTNFGWSRPDEAINQKIYEKFNDHKIIGVIKNFHFNSLHERVHPLMLTLSSNPIKRQALNYISNSWPRPLQYTSIKIKSASISASVITIEKIWKSVAPNKPFDVVFLEDTVKNLYAEEQKWLNIINYASLFAIIIACLGLLGLASIATQKRMKEIGIRKVLGASVSKLLLVISKELLLLVVVANVIAWPIALYVMEKWLEGFAYKVSLTPATFAYSGLVVLIVAILTVSYHLIRAVLANPVTTLKPE